MLWRQEIGARDRYVAVLTLIVVVFGVFARASMPLLHWTGGIDAQGTRQDEAALSAEEELVNDSVEPFVFVNSNGAPMPGGDDGSGFVFGALAAASPIESQPAEAAAPEPSYRYTSDTVRIEITEHNIKNVVYYTAEIWLTDVSQLRSAFSYNKFDDTTERVSDIAERNDAILAINGDFATFNNGGIVIRNGELFRANKSTRQMLLIDVKGDFILYPDEIEDPAATADTFMRLGGWHTLVFGPALVENGEAVPLPEKYFINTEGAKEPRTAIAQLGPLHYLWVIVDGRQKDSQGVSLARLQELLVEHGAVTAYNLDGGGSTTLYFNGEVINHPANGRQRQVPDILMIVDEGMGE